MKKVIILGIILQAMMIPGSFAMNNPGDNVIPGIIRSIEVNADVTVVLGHYGGTQPVVSGDAGFREQVVLKQRGNHLMINALKKGDLKNKVVVYVPADNLVDLRINSQARVHSSGTLDVPMLNVLVNGACQFMIANKGELNIETSALYTLEYKRKEELRPVPFYRTVRK